MRRLHISQSIGDICSRYECTSTNNSEASNSSSIANSRIYNSRLYKGSVVNSANNGFLQKSNSEVICKRGFKPSDRHDPQKKRFLTSLTSKFWKKENDLLNGDSKQIAPNGKKIDLKKLFTPAADFEEHYICPRTHKKMYASSSFYSPNHPTVEEQLELARRISRSLSDISNQRSKGQSMFVNRKKRSVKWVHEGEGKGAPLLEEETSITETEHLQGKKSLKLVMNPRGHVQDLESLRRLGYSIEPTAVSPEICFDLVRDMNTTKGKGAELFAKRRRKSEKWVVDGTNNNNNNNNSITRDAEGSGKNEKNLNSKFAADFMSGPDDILSNNNFYQSSYDNAQYEQKWIDYDTRIKTDSCYGSLPNSSKTKAAADDLCKPKIPRGWSTEHHNGQHHNAEYDSAADGKSSAHSSVNFQAFETNNYNTAARGWKPDMQYYRPVTFQKRLSYTNF